MQHRSQLEHVKVKSGCGQSRKTSVIAMSNGKRFRLIARAKSYRVQVYAAPPVITVRVLNHRGGTIPESLRWHDVQIIPRTHARDDVRSEFNAAVSALGRRVAEWHELCDQYGVNRVQQILDGIASGSAKPAGVRLWLRFLRFTREHFQLVDCYIRTYIHT